MASVAAVSAATWAVLRSWTWSVDSACSVAEVRPLSWVAVRLRSWVEDSELTTSRPFAVLDENIRFVSADSVRPLMAVVEKAAICEVSSAPASAVVSAEICAAERTAICAVVSEATSSVLRPWICAVESLAISETEILEMDDIDLLRSDSAKI